ncbi:hypothetical protein [uncultured Amnibacterium sp.]|uniref:hypothetical protein n=1 Tax=uncultured Amnibacterium sp. TaxID=1631851 RepID=UPI0035C9677E
MDSNASFFGPDGALHQVIRCGSTLTDVSTGRSAFVISDSGGTSLVADQDGRLHQYMKNGSMTTDLTTGATYFEI